MQPSTVNGMELGAQEWRDALFLRYGIDPPDLPHYYNSCNTTLFICHALDCKRGGLVTERRNKLRDGVTDLAVKNFTPTQVHDEILIFTGCAVKKQKANPDGSKTTNATSATPPTEATEQRGDLLIRELRQNGTDSVHSMRVVNTDAKSHSEKTPEKCLHDTEWANKMM